MNQLRRWRQKKKYMDETPKVLLLPLMKQPFFNTSSLLRALDLFPPTNMHFTSTQSDEVGTFDRMHLFMNAHLDIFWALNSYTESFFARHVI